MKYILIILTTLCMISLANAYEVPKDAVIKVFDASGKLIGEMSRSEYKVVKIETSNKVLVQRIADKQYREKHHSIILHAGPGMTGKLSASTDGNAYTIKQREGMVFGATYCFTKSGTGICATGMTNKTYTLGVKKDF